MQPLRAYHPQKYPPLGPRWVQFGDDIMGSATDEMRAMLTRKNQWKREFHVGRLKEHGMLPPAHRDPEDDVMDGFDLPEPSAPPLPPPPRPPQGRRMMERPQPEAVEIYTPQPEHFDIGHDTADESGGIEVNPPAPNMLWTAAKHAGSGALSLGGLLARGVAKGAGAAIDLAIAGNHALVPEEERPQSWFTTADDHQVEDEPLRPFPKVKAKAKAKSSPHPFPAPATPFVPVEPYNGGVFDVSSEEEAPGPAAAARRPRNRGGLANRDLKFARETHAADPNLGRRRG